MQHPAEAAEEEENLYSVGKIRGRLHLVFPNDWHAVTNVYVVSMTVSKNKKFQLSKL